MPVYLVEDTANCRSTKSIHIGLINNMPDGALKATERQFQALLDAASPGFEVQLSIYALQDVPRAEAGRDHVSRYRNIETLWNSRLDGLIVTGTEPRAADLKDEPYWQSLARIFEWAGHNTHSTIWSCLAAHAAVLHFDGIGRRRLSEKRFGVFECDRACDHPLTAGVPSLLQMPHSRWNELPEKELTDCGYRILTRAKDGSVDAFVKQQKSLFVFFQGHPEYEANSLLLEYRRDVGRYLRGERDTYPSMPESYFDQDIIEVLAKLQQRTLLNRHKEMLAEFPTELLEKRLTNVWRPIAMRLYGNWLAYLCAQKERRLEESRARFRVKSARTVSLADRPALRVGNFGE